MDLQSNSEQIINSQVDLLREAAQMVANRVERFEPTEEVQSTIDVKGSLVLIFQIRSLKVYKKVLSYLAEESANPEENRHVFALAHVRTLMDIYAKFIHLLVNCEDDERRALTCLAEQLLIVKGLKSERQVAQMYGIYGDFIKSVEPEFPHITEISHTWLQKNKLAFASRDRLLTQENMNRFSSYSNQLFGTKKSYYLYSHFSEQLHGNPFYYIEKAHNERLWVISMSLMNTSFLIELIDRYILDIGQPNDFRKWLQKVKTRRPEFVELWKTRMTSDQLTN